MEENSHRPVGHEESDVSPWAVGKFAIGLALVCVISLALLFGFFRYLLSEEGGKAPEIVKSPPNPVLETEPPVELKAFRAAEEHELNTYGWVDQQTGIVRIPIERAMDILLQRGFPVRTATPEKQATSKPSGKSAPSLRSE